MANPIKISEAASLAFHAMVLLASRPRRAVSNREVADELGASRAHLAKVLRRLTAAGLLGSSPGPGGGFELAKGANEITLQQVYEAVEGPLEPVECLFEESVCRGEQCIFGGALQEVDRELRAWLADTKLSEVSPVFAS